MQESLSTVHDFVPNISFGKWSVLDIPLVDELLDVNHSMHHPMESHGSPSPQLEGPRQRVAAHHPNSRGHGKARQKRGSPAPQLEGPRQSVGVNHPNLRGHSKAWQSITPTLEAMPKRGSPPPQLEGPRQSVGVHHPNSRGHAKAWESVTTTLGASNMGKETVNRLSSIAPEG